MPLMLTVGSGYRGYACDPTYTPPPSGLRSRLDWTLRIALSLSSTSCMSHTQCACLLLVQAIAPLHCPPRRQWQRRRAR